MMDVQTSSIVGGVVAGAIYWLVCVYHKEEPELVNFFTTALAAVSVVQSFSIIAKIYQFNGDANQPFGVFSGDLMFICFGSIAVIWASIVSILKTYREISLSQGQQSN